MKSKHYFELMAEYNQWINRRIYDVCAKIPNQQRKEDRGAFFKSIHGTLNHLMYGDMAWMKRFTGKEYPLKSLGEEIYNEFEELKQARESLDNEIIVWVSAIDEVWLESPFRVDSTTYKRTRILPAWVWVAHFFNHQTHHRGQLTTLLSQMGYDFGITDLPWMESLGDGGSSPSRRAILG